MTKLSHYYYSANITGIHRGITRLQGITTLGNTPNYNIKLAERTQISIRVDIACRWVKAPPSWAIIRVGIECKRA